mmetsp:Transcript_5101/g.12234  ORF Transcript_5101/g.12234 Transcript_5101/m.12234 type:complete len:204 (+) Transcript_5101:557-1168(+)
MLHRVRGPADLVVEVGGVVDYVVMLMAHPGLQGAVVEITRLLQPFRAHVVVRCGVELFCALGGRNEVDDAVVALIAKRDVRLTQLGSQRVPCLRRHVCLQIHAASVVQHHSRLSESTGDLLHGLFVFELQPHQTRLENKELGLRHLPTSTGLQTQTVEHERCKLRNGCHAIAQSLKSLTHVRHRRTLSAARTSSQHKAVDLHL